MLQELGANAALPPVTGAARNPLLRSVPRLPGVLLLPRCYSCWSARQVEAAAHAKHGGAEGIEQHRTQQMESKVQKRAAKRKEETRKACMTPSSTLQSHQLHWLDTRHMHGFVFTGRGAVCAP